MHYCPLCMTISLSLAQRGVVTLTVNGKQMDTGRFLYNLNKEEPEEIFGEFKNKLEDFFKWYSGFKNKDPIRTIQLASSDFVCENGCVIGTKMKLNIIDVLLPRKKVVTLLKEFSETYKIPLDPESI